MRRGALFVLAALAVVGSTGGAGTAHAGTEGGVRLTLVARLNQPTALAVREGDDALYVAEQTGRVRVVRDGVVDAKPALDLRDRIHITYEEQGLLGLVFSPDGTKLYVDYTNREGDTRLDEYAMTGRTANAESRRELLAVDQPDVSHNGGKLLFGPDGLLYVSLGDGGGAYDQGEGGAPGAHGDPHAPGGNAQSLDTLLGKILRIDPTPSGSQPYTIPPDNPFTTSGRPEIWAYGLRNPWQFSFDRATGDLWIGDVGQYDREEIDHVGGLGPGVNYGWPGLEGTLSHGTPSPPNTVPPIFEYAHAKRRCAVVGGFVYRGKRLPGLRGAYLFADYCGDDIRTLRQSGTDVEVKRLADVRVAKVTAFGQNEAGEPYVMSRSDGLFRLDRA